MIGWTENEKWIYRLIDESSIIDISDNLIFCIIQLFRIEFKGTISEADERKVKFQLKKIIVYWIREVGCSCIDLVIVFIFLLRYYQKIGRKSIIWPTDLFNILMYVNATNFYDSCIEKDIWLQFIECTFEVFIEMVFNVISEFDYKLCVDADEVYAAYLKLTNIFDLANCIHKYKICVEEIELLKIDSEDRMDIDMQEMETENDINIVNYL